MDTQYFYETCAYCEQKDQQKKTDLIKLDAARDRMKADAHAIEQVNNAALKLADMNPKAMFLVEWERNEDGNMKKGKKQDQRAKVGADLKAIGGPSINGEIENKIEEEGMAGAKGGQKFVV